MDLSQNPFHVLGASIRDNRRRIMELADELSLLENPNDCLDARSKLTNPRKRLSAEVAWLPGIGPKRAGELMSLVESSPPDLLAVDNVSPIARVNLLAAGLPRLSDYKPDDVAEWVLETSWAFEDVKPDELTVIINEERTVSGFPEVADLSDVEAEIQERRRHYLQVIKSVLDTLSQIELVEVVTFVVESATDDGKKHGPILMTDLVDSYEVEAQGFLDKEEEKIKNLVDKIRGAINEERPDSTLSPMVNELIQVVRNWDTVAQPIQLSAKSQGLDHDASLRVAYLVRGLVIHMFNEHDKLDFSQQLTAMLQEVFAEVGEIAERTAEDADALDEIADQRVRLMAEMKHRAEEWRREITFEAEVGFFQHKLIISPDGIEWKGRCWDLDSITRVRWGGTRHSVSGIPTGTKYTVVFGDGSELIHIEFKNEAIYSNLTECLWKAVGVRLLREYLEGLRDGKEYRFGTTILSDQGMEFERKKLFGSNERVFCRWDDLLIWNGAGFFCIGTKDKKLTATLSYQDEDNINILEVAIRMFWKHTEDRLSSLLGE